MSNEYQDAGLSTDAISFCISIKNRKWQLEQTLDLNLRSLGEYDRICIADLGSNDGAPEWIWQRFRPEIDKGTLRFFQTKNETEWSSPIAKNLAHRIAQTGYLFGLDADNFVTPEDITLIRACATAGRTCHQWTKTWQDGSYGRIGMPAAVFYEIGGYDDGLLPMGAQDLDLIHRLKAHKKAPEQLGGPTKSAIQNTKETSIANVPTRKHSVSYKEMNDMNMKFTRMRRQIFGSARPQSFQTHQGFLNGRPVMIDGLNGLHFEPSYQRT